MDCSLIRSCQKKAEFSICRSNFSQGPYSNIIHTLACVRDSIANKMKILTSSIRDGAIPFYINWKWKWKGPTKFHTRVITLILKGLFSEVYKKCLTLRAFFDSLSLAELFYVPYKKRSLTKRLCAWSFRRFYETAVWDYTGCPRKIDTIKIGHFYSSTLIQNETVSFKKSKMQSCSESKMKLITFAKGHLEAYRNIDFLFMASKLHQSKMAILQIFIK